MNSHRGKGRERLVYIATAANEAVANLWKSVLEENSIYPPLKGINLIASMYVSPASLQCEIYVLESDVEKAREALTPFLEEEES